MDNYLIMSKSYLGKMNGGGRKSESNVNNNQKIAVGKSIKKFMKIYWRD